jgi:predicted HTH transcriptional regulator
MKSIEMELGLSDFSECEKDIIAFFSDNRETEIFTTPEISADAIMAQHSRPTIFRSIASLIDRGFIERVGPPKSGVYRILKDI